MIFFNRLLIGLLAWLLMTGNSYAQDAAIADKVIAFPQTLMNKLSGKSARINDLLEKQSIRYLQRLQKKEVRLKRKLYQIDSLKAKMLFTTEANKYTLFINRIKHTSTTQLGNMAGPYFPYLDSVKGVLAFLEKHPSILTNAKAADIKLQASLGEIHQLQARLQQSEQIKVFIQQRREQIKESLNQYTQLPKGLTKQYATYSQNVYYYQAQMKAYKDMLKDPDKIEQKALELLRKLPAYKSFMQQHSILASLFGMPANYGTPMALSGLQTRVQVQQVINTRMAGASIDAQQMLQENMQQAQTLLKELKNKVNQLGGNNNDIEMPDFKPNEQRTRSFKQRIELGGNLQTVKSTRFFPTTTDIAASAGYKLNNKSIVGIGAAYKVGWGKDISHIAFTSEGIGVRTFLEYKLKGSIWVTGGAEMNYRNRFDRLEVLKNYSSWQQSALIGMSKKYQVSKKVKGNAQLLYDALWKQQVPRAQAVVFRIGYAIQ